MGLANPEACEEHDGVIGPTQGEIARSGRPNDALREREKYYRAVIENVADAIAINVGTKRVFVNKTFLGGRRDH